MEFFKGKFANEDESGGGGSSYQSGAAQARGMGQKIVGDIFKKAVNMGASAVEKAENTVNKTLAMNPANLSKEVIKEVLESFFENYTIQINAEIKLNPRVKGAAKKDDKNKE